MIKCLIISTRILNIFNLKSIFLSPDSENLLALLKVLIIAVVIHESVKVGCSR
jgi:hypothetical protein